MCTQKIHHLKTHNISASIQQQIFKHANKKFARFSNLYENKNVKSMRLISFCTYILLLLRKLIKVRACSYIS